MDGGSQDKKPKTRPVKRHGGQKSKREKRDVDIMNVGISTLSAHMTVADGNDHSADLLWQTNDSSIVSKRSVCKLYFSKEPDYYEPVVPKFVRRNPLINRGYWLRMHAIEQVVRQFLEDNTGRKKLVVNLGCG